MMNTSATGGPLLPTSTPVLDDDALDDFIQAQISGISGITGPLVRPGLQPVAPPTPDITVTWATFQIGTTKLDPWAYVGHQHNQAIFQRHEQFDVQVRFYGPAASTIGKVFRDGLSIGQNREPFQLQNMGLAEVSKGVRLGEYINGQYYRRFDLSFAINREVSRVYSVLDLLSAVGTLDMGDISLAFATTVPQNQFRFRVGLNVSGLEDGSALPGTQGVDYIAPTAAELAHYASAGIPWIRLPFLWERMQPVQGGLLDPTYLGYYVTAIQEAYANGMLVLADCHNFGGGYGYKVGTAQLPGTALGQLWVELDKALTPYQHMIAGYDIMNEPSDMPVNAAGVSVWKLAAQQTIDAIRAVNMNVVLYIEGDGYSGAGAWLDNNADFQPIDPANNFVMSAHLYLDRDSSGKHFSWITENGVPLESAPNIGGVHTDQIGVQRLQPFLQYCQTYGYRGHIGEIGAGTDQDFQQFAADGVTVLDSWNPNWRESGWNTALYNTLQAIQEAGMEASYWNAGGYSLGYPMGVEPSTVAGSLQWPRPMAVLTMFTGEPTAPTVFLSGPTRGQPGAMSQEFVIDLRGELDSPVTVTPTDFRNTGGTFTPASITVGPSANAIATFTWTAPAGAGVVAAIGVTCPTGVIAPQEIGYSTKADLFTGLSVTPMQIYSSDLLYTPYIGPVQRTSNAAGVFQDFYPTVLAADGVTYTVNQAAVTAYSGGVGRTYYYDQSPNGFHQTPVTTDNQNGAVTFTPSYSAAPLGPQPNDPPLFVANGLNGKPVVDRTNSRVDAPSALGSTSLGFFCVARPKTLAGMQNYFGWQFIDYYVVAGDNNGDMQMSNESSQYLNMQIDPTAFHAYGGGYTVGTNGVWEIFRDGALVAEATPTATSINYRYRNGLRMGYGPFEDTYSSVLDAELILFYSAPSPADHAALTASAQSRWGTPIPPGQVTGLAVESTGPTTAMLLWTPVASATGYTVQYRITGSSAWTTAAAGVTADPYTVTGLVARTSYDFQVFATEGAGIGTPSSVVTASTTAYPAGPGLKLQHIGINLSGLENSPNQYISNGILPNAAFTTQFIAQGFNLFRICFDGTQAFPTLGGPPNMTYLANLLSAVTTASAGGARVIIDMHNFGSMYGYSIGTAPLTNAVFANMWAQLVPIFSAFPNLGYDLQNEPQLSAAVAEAAWIAAAAAIRAAETAAGIAHRTIYYPMPGYNAGSAASAGVPFIQAIVAADTGGQALRRFEFHQYMDSNGSGTQGTVASLTVGPERIQAFVNILRITGEQGYLGETGWGIDGLCGTAAGAQAAGTNLMNYLAQNADAVPDVSPWGGGDFASVEDNGYFFGINPSSSGKVTPYVQQLQQYMPGGQYYGYPQVAQAFPLNMQGSISYAAASLPAYGQALQPGGWGSASDGANQFNCEFYQKARFVLSPTATISNTPAIIGCDGGPQGMCVTSAGYLGIIGGPTSTIKVNDGQPHDVEYGVKQNVSYLFHEGVLVATGSSGISHTNGSSGFSTNVGNYKNGSNISAEAIEYAAYYGVCLYTATHAAPSGPPPMVGDPGRIAYWPLDGNGTGYA